ncbi:unnamed protein product [Durusdinium trenchii]|uniref:Fibronectin type-III domain-containing protein n=1 Tax=Durusdinium trenchii TaxID=1381693 RepID=A0ABP0SYF9_9DINO
MVKQGCSSLGGIQRCPPERPWMCESPSTCEESCASYGGRKSCSPSEWPANSPEIFEAASFAPASLSLRFGPRSYLSNNVSNCVFSRWDVQLAKVLPDSSLDTWTHLPQCDFAGSRELQSCQADDLDFLQYYQVRFAELCTDSGLDSLYNWTEPILIRGALAGSPVNLTVTVLSSSALLLRWDASSAGDCSFAAWKVEWQSGGASETWSPAELCQDLTERNQTECLLDTLTAMESYRVQITETCTDVRTNSLPATSPVFRFQEINSWEIYLGPTMSLAISVSTLVTDLDQCEVITTCCDDQFSICYARTAAVPLLATISRTDAVAGWGQQLWLRCSNSGDPLPSVPAAAPSWVELREVSQSSMVAAYSLGHAPGDCLCAHPHLQLRESGSEWVSVYGDCADMTLRACTLTNLLPDRVYDVRIQLACCTWSTSSGNSTGYECEAAKDRRAAKDGSFCATEGCCSPRRCPDHMPVMCADSSCNGHFCCAADSAGCDTKGGVRPCLESQVPAKEPSILQVDSPSSSSLQITWTPGRVRCLMRLFTNEDDRWTGWTWLVDPVPELEIDLAFWREAMVIPTFVPLQGYASGFTAPCGQGGVSEFLQWSVQVTEAEECSLRLSFVAAAFLHVPLRAFETAFRAPLSAGAAPLEEERWRSVECSGSRSSNVCLIENLLADRFYEAVVPFEEVVQVMRRKVVQELGFIFQG